MRSLQVVALYILLNTINYKFLSAQSLPYDPPTPIPCSPTENCPQEYPCCSQFWTCGTGPVCVTGCNPKNSFNNFSCLRGPAFMPESFVKRKTIKVKNRKSSKSKSKKTKKNEILNEKIDFVSEDILNEYIDDKQNIVSKRDNVETIHNNDMFPMVTDNVLKTGESVYIHADDDEIRDYFELSSLHKRDELEAEIFTINSNKEESYIKKFHFKDILIRHKNSEAFVKNSKSPINSYAGDHMMIDDQEIIPWTEYLITDSKRSAKKHWDNVGFTYSGIIKKITDDEDNSNEYLYLAMPKRSAGSLLTTTRSLLYGRVGVSLKTGQGRGVITTFVLFSNVHDEIDFEFLGGDLLHAQTNYYHQGELIHTRMVKAYTETNIHDEWHYYEIDWNEERIHWLVDGRIVRTLQKVDTWDPLRQIYKYPQTPMKLHVSIWPGGSESNSPGTIDWAGGLVDWENSPDIVQKGEFDCKIEYISIEPYFNQKMAEHKSSRELETKVQPNKRIGYVFEHADDEYEYLEKNVKLSNEEIVFLKSMKNTGNSPI